MLFRYPTLSLGAILTLGVGIGLSTTVFCVVNGGLFKGLPFPDADRIVAVYSSSPAQGQPRLPIAVQDLAVIESRQTSFEFIGAYGSAPYNLSLEDGHAERLPGGQLTLAAYRALGVKPMLGRGFEDGDDQPGAGNVVLLGHALWRDRYGSAPDIVGRTIRANGVQLTVIGVMPPEFAFPIRESLWVPLRIDPLATPRGQGPRYQAVGLLNRGTTASEASAQLAAIATQLEREFPASNRGIGAGAVPYTESLFNAEIYAMLFTMLGAGIGVLLIACVNVSNLLVARASLRRKEVAVRMALGAARGRIIRQHLTEVVVLASAGASSACAGSRRRCRTTRRLSGSGSTSITASCCSCWA
jgi:predicted permease